MADIERLIQSLEARANRGQKSAQRAIDNLAKAAFTKMWAWIQENPGADAREAIKAAQVEFGGGFAEALAQAFSELLERSIGTAEVRALPVGDITLSRRMYLHSVQLEAEVTALIREHAKGMLQARELSLALYDGYDPERGIQRPLEGRARADLPKALRSLTEDLTARRELTALQVAGQKQADRLKSQALRAAYMETFRAWEAGAGEEVLRRRLEIAQKEKNRFFADRIAQTELHSAHMAQVSQELMDDERLTVVQVRLNPTHPRPDICDLHALADLWGLGPGCYPKEKAPRPGFHPFCRCRLRPRPSLSASNATRAPGGEAAYLAGLGRERASMVMGSEERADRVMSGTPAETVINTGLAQAYRLKRVGDVKAQMHPLVREREPA